MSKRFDGAPSRRLILKGAALAALTAGLPFGATSAGAATPARYPEDAFRQKEQPDAIKALYGRTAESSDKIKLDAPEIAENGTVVPISVTTSLEKVSSISFLVSDNPNALAATYRIPEGTVPAVANRLKMAKTSNVTVIVEADGKLYSTSKEVKVTVGGCGG